VNQRRECRHFWKRENRTGKSERTPFAPSFHFMERGN
jgi:hypothetical protein